MKYIALSSGFVAKVSDQDYEWLSKFSWYAHVSVGSSRGNRYACRKRRKNECPDSWKRNQHVSMHREILNAPIDKDVDHINGDGLDNRRENLRLVTKTQNMQNARLRKTNKTGYKGVSWDGQTKKWRAWIQVNKRFINLGRFKTIEEAIRVRQQAEKEHFIQSPM